MRKSEYDDGGPGARAEATAELGSRLLAVLGVCLIVPALMTVWWMFIHFIAPGTRYPYDFDRWEMTHWFPEGWNLLGGTPYLWVFILILTIIAVVILAADTDYGASGLAAFLVGVVGIPLCMFVAGQGFVSRDKVAGQFYQQGTTFFVANPEDLPSAVTRLGQDAGKKPVGSDRKGKDGCAIKPVHDVSACVKKGSLLDKPGLWVGRTSSYTGARTVLASSTANQQGADLMEPSLTYLGGDKPETERWSGVIDGSGAYNQAQGVVEWYGKTNTIKKCLFGNKHSGTQSYRFNRAFGGAKRNSLSHLILSTYTGYTYQDDDVWGYCAGNKPVLVVPMVKHVPYHHQAPQVPAGTLIIRGSESGDPVLDFRKEVKRGELDGPVVPQSIIAKQRETLDWAAGRKFRKSSGGNNGGFGFDVASAETQAGNNSEYRLYNTAEKRWYFASPLVPNNARSQTYTAMALTPTDEVRSGVLPSLNVYVFEDDPAKQANADRMHSAALTYLSTADPGFRTNGGELKELTPLGGDMWRVYAEVKGYTTHYIDMSANGRVTPNLVTLNTPVPGVGTPTVPVKPGQTGTPSQAACGKQIGQMKVEEKVACMKALTDDLAKRQGTPR